MANRVCLGKRSVGQIGLFISKPGVDVLTAADADLLFSSSINAMQMIVTGTIAVPNYSQGGNPYATIGYPDLGYIPTVLILPHITDFADPLAFAGGVETWCSNMSVTGCRIHAYLTAVVYSGFCTYGVLRKPYNA